MDHDLVGLFEDYYNRVHNGNLTEAFGIYSLTSTSQRNLTSSHCRRPSILMNSPLFIIPITNKCAKNIRISPPLIFFHLLICANFFIGIWSTEMNKCQGSINNNICPHHFYKSTPFQKGLCCNVHKITLHNYHKTTKHYSHKPISSPLQTNQ